MPEESIQTHLLDGILVVEIGRRAAAAACGSLMADAGADVVCVETVDGPDISRVLRVAGKRSLAVDPARSGDDDALAGLLHTADVVLLSTDADPWQEWIWERQRPEHQVICDFTAYGRTGPLRGRAHSEAMVQAVAAVAETTGSRDGPPTFTGAPFLDMETAVYGFAAVMAARLAVRRSGKGQRIDMALYDVGVNALLTFMPLLLAGRVATRNGNRHPTLAPWNAYSAADGWVLICGPTDDQWRRLCAAMERPELATDGRFASTTARLDNIDVLDAVIGDWVAGQTMEDCMARVAAQHIPCSPIVRLSELQSDPNLRHRGVVATASDPLSGRTFRVPGNPLRLAGTAPFDAKPVPQPDADRAWCRNRASGAEGPRSAGDQPQRERPLEGIRVIEIGMNTVAPLACRQLGALGADVIKVEPPSGDTNRWNTPLRADGQSYLFAMSNTDKRGVVLDLKEAPDRERLWRLLATADVVIENLKPGSVPKLGFGADAVRARFPRIVYCSVNGFGYDSAYPGRPALDTVIQGMSGAMDVTPVGSVPTKAGISISDQLGGQFGLAGILAALEARERTGTGATFDISMQDCSAWATQLRWNDDATPPPPLPELVEVLDGRVAVASTQTGPDWPAVVDAAAARGLTRRELVERLEAGGIEAAPVQGVAEVVAHEQTKARELFRTVTTADGSEWLVNGPPFRLLSTPAVVSTAMPRLGFRDRRLFEELGWPDEDEEASAWPLREAVGR